MSHYTYVLRCDDGSLYTGYTTDISRRVEEHNLGQGAKYTKSRTPVRLVRVELFNEKGEAMSREHEIKQFSKENKEAIVSEEDDIVRVSFHN